MPLACAPESSVATAHSHTGRRQPIAPGRHSAPRGCFPRGIPPLARPAPAATRDPRSALVEPPGAVAAAASRRVAGATRGWGRAGEAGGGLCTD